MKEGSNAIVDDGNDKWNGERQNNYTKKNVWLERTYAVDEECVFKEWQKKSLRSRKMKDDNA